MEVNVVLNALLHGGMVTSNIRSFFSLMKFETLTYVAYKRIIPDILPRLSIWCTVVKKYWLSFYFCLVFAFHIKPN